MSAFGPPRRTVGVLGGGQLGRMLALAGHPLGFRCLVVEPGGTPPAMAVADVRRSPYDHPAALAWLAQECDVVTVELEGVPVDALRWLEDQGVPVRPCADAVAVAQDRLTEKRRLTELGVPVARFGPEVSPPALLKARHGGYDGRGQRLVRTTEELHAAYEELGSDTILEELLDFRRELSIVAVRGVDGATAFYPLVENRHTDGILRVSLAPAPGITDELTQQAQSIAAAVLDGLDYVGVLAIELFERDGMLLANEIAPRVHNSGHWTIEGAETSQFENHLRAVGELPIGSTRPRGHSAMVNLIGGTPEVEDVLAVPGAHLHLYGKAPRPGRKVGHVTVVADDPGERDARLHQVVELVAVSERG